MPRRAGDRNSALTRARLFEAAARLFRERGFAGTSIRAIAHEMGGFQSASIYYYIDDKEDLLYQICREALGEITSQIEDLARSEASPLDRCREIVRAHLTVMLGERDWHAALLLELKSLSAPHRAELVEMRDRYESTVRGVLEEAIEDGSFRSDQSPAILTRLLLGMMNWSIFWFDPSGSLSSADLSDEVLDLFLTGAMLDLPGGGLEQG